MSKSELRYKIKIWQARANQLMFVYENYGQKQVTLWEAEAAQQKADQYKEKLDNIGW